MSDAKPCQSPIDAMPKKQRLDLMIVQRGLAADMEKARRMIMAGEILVADQVVDKPSIIVTADAQIRTRNSLPYVSRGGLKLTAALDEFDIAVAERIAVDVGASTGGFTDCLLQRHTNRVFAIDVGYGDLAWSLRQDPRVVVIERTNIRHLPQLPADEDGTIPNADLAVIDTSFISLRVVLPATINLLTESADIIALVKPQFEANKADVETGGVVRDSNIHVQVLRKIVVCAQKLKLQIAGLTISPVLGPAGNVEFLLWMRRSSHQRERLPNQIDDNVEALIQQSQQRAKALQKSKR